MTEFRNPKPVVVLLVNTTRGVLLVRRGIPGEGHGRLALPGGYQVDGETWQAAGCREVREETGLELDPRWVTVSHVETVGAQLDCNLIYGEYFGVVPVAEGYTFSSDETLAVEFATTAIDLAFPSHTEQLAFFLDQHRRDDAVTNHSG